MFGLSKQSPVSFAFYGSDLILISLVNVNVGLHLPTQCERTVAIPTSIAQRMHTHRTACGPEEEKDVKNKSKTKRRQSCSRSAHQSRTHAPLLKTSAAQRWVLQRGRQGTGPHRQSTRHAQILQQLAEEEQQTFQGRHEDWVQYQNRQRE